MKKIEIEQITDTYGLTKFGGSWYVVDGGITIHKEFKEKSDALIYLVKMMDVCQKYKTGAEDVDEE